MTREKSQSPSKPLAKFPQRTRKFVSSLFAAIEVCNSRMYELLANVNGICRGLGRRRFGELAASRLRVCFRAACVYVILNQRIRTTYPHYVGHTLNGAPEWGTQFFANSYVPIHDVLNHHTGVERTKE